MQECRTPELRISPQEAAEMSVPESSRAISPSDVLAMIPCGRQFLFLDEILAVDRTHISARYRFRKDQFFYAGHFPERAVTPGTILLEAMCQCGVTAHSYYFLAHELGVTAARRYRVLFTNSEVEWFELVPPGTCVTIQSELLAWRLRRIRARVKMFSETNSLIAQAILAGTSVSWHPDDARKNSLNPASEEGEIAGNTRQGAPDES